MNNLVSASSNDLQALASHLRQWQAEPAMPAPQPEPVAAGGGDKIGAGNDTAVTYDTSADQDVVVSTTGDGDTHAIDVGDVDQGQIADCYVMAAIGAYARNNPDAIEEMIQDNGDGTYTVTFHEKQSGFLGIGGGYKEVQITVNAEFPDSKGAQPSTDGGKTEIWPLILEKAYAQYKGGYEALSNGGTPDELLQLLTGRDAETIGDLGDGGYAFDQMKADFDAGQPITLNVPKDYNGVDKALAEKYDLYAWHYYVVTGVGTDASGQQYVEVYNPHGGEPPQRIPYDDAMQMFDNAVTA